MIGSRQTFPGRAMPWRAALPASGWRDGAAVFPLVVALTLWAAVIAGALAPLSGALARLDPPAPRAPAGAPCRVPPGALASATAPVGPPACR